MKTRRILMLVLTAIICASCFAGCSWGKNPVEAKYETFPYGEYVIRENQWYDENEKKLHHVLDNVRFGDSDLLIISDFDEYKAADIYDFERSEEFFAENALLIMKYEHSSSDEPIELVDIAIKDGKLYPVVSMELPYESPSCDDIKDTYIIADVKKSDAREYSWGELLALNLADENSGSLHHEKFE